MILVTICTVSKTLKQSKCPSVWELINKVCSPYNGISFSNRKEQVTIHDATKQMNLQSLTLSKGSQAQIALYYMIPFKRYYTIFSKKRKGERTLSNTFYEAAITLNQNQITNAIK